MSSKLSPFKKILMVTSPYEVRCKRMQEVNVALSSPKVSVATSDCYPKARMSARSQGLLVVALLNCIKRLKNDANKRKVGVINYKAARYLVHAPFWAGFLRTEDRTSDLQPGNYAQPIGPLGSAVR